MHVLGSLWLKQASSPVLFLGWGASPTDVPLSRTVAISQRLQLGVGEFQGSPRASLRGGLS